jgi:hypothetical protein
MELTVWHREIYPDPTIGGNIQKIALTSIWLGFDLRKSGLL